MSESALMPVPPDSLVGDDSVAPEVFAPERPERVIRWAAGVEYQGTRYHGFQSQRGDSRTVQHHLETAIGDVANHPVKVHCAGRTDARVHATEQVIHFDTACQRPPFGWMLGANTSLPDDISLQWVMRVPPTFHARFAARARRYRYVIYNHLVPSAVLRHSVTWEKHPLDANRMHRAAQCLVGQHDFSAFRAAACQAHNPVRRVTHCRVERLGKLIILDVRADAFLHHMVRNMAGVLMTIGRGTAPVDWAAEVLATGDRQLGGVTARPEGLYLIAADYDSAFRLPAPALGPAFLPMLDERLESTT